MTHNGALEPAEVARSVVEKFCEMSRHDTHDRREIFTINSPFAGYLRGIITTELERAGQRARREAAREAYEYVAQMADYFVPTRTYPNFAAAIRAALARETKE